MPFGRLEKMKLAIFKDCGVHCSDADDASGGIASFWNPIIIQGMTIFSISNHVTTRFTNLKDGSSWIISNIYALNSKNARKALWTSLINAR